MLKTSRWLNLIVIAALLIISNSAVAGAKTVRQRWSGGACTALIAQRNSTFDRNRRELKSIADMKRRISADDAQIKLLSGLSEPSEEAAAKKQLAQSQKTLGSLQAMQRRDAADLAKLDAQIAECRKSSPGERPQAGNAAIAPFVGTWNNGMAGGPKYHVTGHGRVLNYTIESSYERGGGECTVAGVVATCRWHSQISENTTGTPFVIYASGRSEMHLYGERMNVKYFVDAASYQPDLCTETDPIKCGHMYHPGATWTVTWDRG